MIVKLNLTEEELNPIIELHLTEGIAVQTYIKAAIRYFNKMLAVERKGSKCGFGSESRFTSYNTEISPTNFLEERE